MSFSKLDVIYRKILITKFFTKGWGCPDNLLRLFDFRKIISNRESCYNLVDKSYPITIINDEKRKDCRIIEGRFQSPFALYFPGLVSREIEDAYFQMVLPLKWNSDNYKPMCIHLAGTGDHYFWRRRNIMVKPLLKSGIGAIILENPYYGLRKPKTQSRSSLHYVSDIFVMGGCLVLECLVLLNWCERLSFGPLGVTGISMGGHMASLAASNWPKPLVLVPCLSWSTASSVFTEGVMSESIDWKMLQQQYMSNKLYYDTLSQICKIVDDPRASSLSKLQPDILFESLFQSKHPEYVTPKELLQVIQQASSKEKCDAVAQKSFKLFQNDLKVENRKGTEALWFMRGIMDECTHLKNFSTPFDTSLITAVCAQSDGYVPRKGVSTLEDIWPGATVRYVDCGHVGACLWYRNVFIESIVDAFYKAKTKYPVNGLDVQEVEWQIKLP